MGRWLGTVAVVALALAGCGKKHPADKVTYVADDDPRMNAAMAKARATVKSFTAARTNYLAGTGAKWLAEKGFAPNDRSAGTGRNGYVFHRFHRTRVEFVTSARYGK